MTKRFFTSEWLDEQALPDESISIYQVSEECYYEVRACIFEHEGKLWKLEYPYSYAKHGDMWAWEYPDSEEGHEAVEVEPVEETITVYKEKA